ncbi:MAG: anti-sigma factor family protein [Planctomycetota bacterium]|jgi:anti-sigma factor RsiW
MNMTQEMLEIMIGKYLDGEITPSEQRLLEAQLDKDPRAKELLEQLQQMHQRCAEAVAAEVLGQGRTPEDVFEQAWHRRSNRPLQLTAKMRGHGRFAAGVAAGLLIGLALHFVLPLISTGRSEPAAPKTLAQDTVQIAPLERRIVPTLATDRAGDEILNVDWYNFTDSQGNKWLVEGISENKVRPAAYYEGL